MTALGLSDLICSRYDIKIVPILVGSLSHDQEVEYGAYLSKYVNDADTLFAISSDFSHWWVSSRNNRYSLTNDAQGDRDLDTLTTDRHPQKTDAGCRS